MTTCSWLPRHRTVLRAKEEHSTYTVLLKLEMPRKCYDVSLKLRAVATAKSLTKDVKK